MFRPFLSKKLSFQKLFFDTVVLFFLAPLFSVSASGKITAAIISVSLDEPAKKFSVTWNQLQPLKEKDCMAELTADKNWFYSPVQPNIDCSTTGVKTATVDISNFYGLSSTFYTVIVNNGTGDIISDFALVKGITSSSSPTSAGTTLTPNPIAVPNQTISPSSSSVNPSSSVSSVPTAMTQPVFNRNLSIGLSGDDIKELQKILKSEGVYPEAYVTGYFGELTKKAVIRFQEKYREEILAPFGLIEGTGFVGKATRAKIEKIIFQTTTR